MRVAERSDLRVSHKIVPGQQYGQDRAECFSLPGTAFLCLFRLPKLKSAIHIRYKELTIGDLKDEAQDEPERLTQRAA